MKRIACDLLEVLGGADKSLAPQTSHVFSLMVRIFRLMLVLLYRMFQEEWTKLRESVPYVEL